MAFKVYVFLGLILSLTIWQFIHRELFKWLAQKSTGQKLFLIDKITFYSGFLIIVMIALRLVGANLNDLLATAGVVTVAIGFAAKTSVSHFISGFILLGTKVIKRGDLIEVDEYIGVIEDIDIFSTHLRTFENILVSLPNEKLLNEYVSNYSNYPIRRISCEVLIRVEDLNQALVKNLEAEIKKIQVILVEPEPLIMIESEPGKGIKLGLRAWCEAKQFVTARNYLILSTAEFLTQNQVRCYSELALYNTAEH
jgi:small-conductance mechanosensitive channel